MSAIMQLLTAKHARDVFVPECKNGPTQTGNHRRLDAWVLLKTWSPVTTIGYEVKASRSDWRRDAKLDEYAGLVHLLYVVAPKGIVPIEEVPPGVGLIEMTHDRLVTRRKADRRAIEMPIALLVYVLMCRTAITSDRAYNGFDRKETISRELREWVSGRDERRQMSYAVSKKIREQFDAQEHELARLTQRLKELEAVEQRIRELGFDPSRSYFAWDVSRRLEALAGVVPPYLLAELDRTVEQLGRVKHGLEPFIRQKEGKTA